jgi:PAS domain S-box-containing protein
MQSKAQKRLIAGAIVAALLGPLAGLAAQRVVRRADDLRALDRFGAKVNELQQALEAEVADARRIVGAAAALLSTSETTTSGEFTSFAVELMARGSEIHALEWVPLVPLSERGRHEAEAGRDLGTGYTITEWTASGSLAPVSTRDRYFPVRFIEPRVGNEWVLGFDLGSDPITLDALSRAAATGQATISRLLRLDQGSGQSTSFLLVIPVFRAAAADRGTRVLSGFAVGVVRASELISAAMPDRGYGGTREMVVDFVDDAGTSASEGFSARPVERTPDLVAGAVVRREIHLDGQSWTLIARPTPAYWSRSITGRAAAIGIGVFLGYELLLALALTASRWSLEKTRREQAEFARSVIHSVSEGVMVADAKGRMTIVNEAARRMLGRGPLNLPRTEWSRAFGLFMPGTEQHFPTDQLPLPRAVRGEEVPETEIFVRNAQIPDGAWTSVTGSPLKDANGNLIGGVVVFRDVTHQKRTQELSQRLSNAVEQAADSVFITNRAGVIEYVNPAFEATTGYSREAAVGRTPQLLKSGLQSPEYYKALWETIVGGVPFKGTVINRKRSGEHFHAEQTITPIRDHSTGEIIHFVSVMRDMTERIRLQESEIEMRVGASVQQRLFPQHPPEVPGYDIAGAVAPSSATCGDYYDFIPLPDGRLALAIADVSGHGVGAALIMTATRAYLRSLARTVTPLDRLAEELNRLLLADLEERFFVTMILALLDGRSGALTWANLGHPTGYLLDWSGAVKAELKSGCGPLGLFPKLSCKHGSAITLEWGDTLVLLTDGILEAASQRGDELGSAAVLEIVRSVIDRPAAEIADRIIAAAQAFVGEQQQEDDLTVVVCKRTAPPPSTS